MFTLDQIIAAHAKVKSGADFPAYIQEMRLLGVQSYEHFAADGHIQYYGAHGFTMAADAKWPALEIAETGSAEKLKHALFIHQQGQTDYPTFCSQSAEAGVEKWTVDMIKMTCTYYDKASNEILVEAIPTV